MNKIGVEFPQFHLETYFPEKKTSDYVNNKTYAGKWLVVFYYPADFTFVCPTELKDLAGRYQEVRDLNAEILAVSTDTVFTHKAWLESEKLLQDVIYPLAADHDGELAKSLNIFNQGSGIADRAVYIVDPDNQLQACEIVAENIGRSAGEIVRKLKALDHVRKNPGIACPASWDTGAKDLKPGLEISGKVFEQLEK